MKYSVPKEKYKKINKDIKKGHEKISGDTVPCEAMSPLFFLYSFLFFYIFPSAPPAQLTIRKAGRWTRRVLPRSWLVRLAELQAGLLVGTVRLVVRQQQAVRLWLASRSTHGYR